MDNGFHRIDDLPKGVEPPDRVFDPASTVLRGGRVLAANDNRTPLPLRLKRLALLLIAAAAAIWLCWTGLR
ncbi:MAG TPA: hypothetical protein VGV37_28525 [Aliidongia sp.]|uniref:hypothetical protein n=1 Tax=Aliidongia sp. TaxID=1914230 RepID=UPI002DDD9428|nr:hypothetical protein [Aliidongia sp.]HEV2678505.1 hypothetical protein [Aliidongia sp.]